MKKTISTIGWSSLREIHERDFEQVMAIAKACSNEVGMDAIGGSRIARWTIGPRLWEWQIALKLLNPTSNKPIVMTVGGTVVGYLLYSVHGGTTVVRQIGVAPEFTRERYGTEMIERLKQSLPNLKSRFIGVQIAEKNLGAQVFFRHCGFKWFRSAGVPASGDQSYFMRYIESA